MLYILDLRSQTRNTRISHKHAIEKRVSEKSKGLGTYAVSYSSYRQYIPWTFRVTPFLENPNSPNLHISATPSVPLFCGAGAALCSLQHSFGRSKADCRASSHHRIWVLDRVRIQLWMQGSGFRVYDSGFIGFTVEVAGNATSLKHTVGEPPPCNPFSLIINDVPPPPPP